MKKVTNLQHVQDIINRKEDFYQDVNGRTYNVSFITILGMKLLDIITMIKEGRLFYQPEH